jgi:hypothetical protein
VAQLSVYLLRMAAKLFAFMAVSGLREAQDCKSWTGVLLVFVLLWLPMMMYLFTLFLLEGFALPMGTKDGEIAFSSWNGYGLNVTCIVVLGWGLLVLCLAAVKVTSCITDFLQVVLLLSVAVGMLAVSVHSLVTAILYAVDHWEFVSTSMFFIAWRKEFLAFRVVRTIFSALIILDSVLAFAAFNMEGRLQSDYTMEPPDKLVLPLSPMMWLLSRFGLF